MRLLLTASLLILALPLLPAQPADLVADLESALKVGIVRRGGPKVSEKAWAEIDERIRRDLIGSGASDEEEKVMLLLGGWGKTGVVTRADNEKITPVDLGKAGSSPRKKAEEAGLRFVVSLSKIKIGFTGERKVPFGTSDGKITVTWRGVDAGCRVDLIDLSVGDKPIDGWDLVIEDKVPSFAFITEEVRKTRRMVATKDSAMKRIVARAAVTGAREALARRFWARRGELEKAVRNGPLQEAARLAFAAVPLQIDRFAREIRHPRPDATMLRAYFVKGSEITLGKPTTEKRWRKCPWCDRGTRTCRGAAFCPTRRFLYMVAEFDYFAGRGQRINNGNMDQPKPLADFFEATSKQASRFAATRVKAAEARTAPTDATLKALDGPQVVLVTEDGGPFDLAADPDLAHLASLHLVAPKPGHGFLAKARLKATPPYAMLVADMSPEQSRKDRRRKVPLPKPKVLAKLSGDEVTAAGVEGLLIRAAMLAAEARIRSR